MCDTYTCLQAEHIHKRQTHLLVREDVRAITVRVQFKKETSFREPQAA
jgi:hypothetical protein